MTGLSRRTVLQRYRGILILLQVFTLPELYSFWLLHLGRLAEIPKVLVRDDLQLLCELTISLITLWHLVLFVLEQPKMHC